MATTTALDVSHLWNRAAFGISAEGAEARAGRPWSQLVDELVDADPAPMPKPAALSDPAMNGMEWMRYAHMAAAWMDHMAATPAPGAEKLAWFWHNHFPTAFDKVMWCEGLWRQLTTLRSRGHGPFRTLLGEMVIDSAMALYLDNISNLNGRINENLGRELLELFTVGTGNYTEKDVVEAARCLTGHNVAWGTTTLLPTFYPTLHDNGMKTVLGATGNYDANGLCDVLTSGTPRLNTARHIVRRLWNAWVYPDPHPHVVATVAQTALANGFTGRALMRAVLMHPHFVSPYARQNWFRTPLEIALNVARATGLTPTQLGTSDALNRARHYPFMPHNVSGWPTARDMCTPSAWWELGQLHVRATNLLFLQQPGRVPATTGEAPDAAVRTALRWAGVLDPAPRTVTDMAAALARVRTGSPSSEPSFLVMAAFLTPDFATGGIR